MYVSFVRYLILLFSYDMFGRDTRV